jgi:hypothetical protein
LACKAGYVSWQYAQLTVTEDSRPYGQESTFTVIWQGPGQGLGENFSESDQTILQLLNRFHADGWELAAVQERREGILGGRNWDAPWSQMAYTFKRELGLGEIKDLLVHGPGEAAS